jgi:hypothetical protein
MLSLQGGNDEQERDHGGSTDNRREGRQGGHGEVQGPWRFRLLQPVEKKRLAQTEEGRVMQCQRI